MKKLVNVVFSLVVVLLGATILAVAGLAIRAGVEAVPAAVTADQAARAEAVSVAAAAREEEARLRQAADQANQAVSSAWFWQRPARRRVAVQATQAANFAAVNSTAAATLAEARLVRQDQSATTGVVAAVCIAMILLAAIIAAVRMVVVELRELVGWQRLASPEAWSDAPAVAPAVAPDPVTPPTE